MAFLGHRRVLDQSDTVVFGERKGGTLAIFKALCVFVPEKGVELWLYSWLCICAREG